MSLSERKSGGNHAGPAHDSAGGMRWLLTYADMITLLLALFIYLFSISTVNIEKLQAFSNTFVTLFGFNKAPAPMNSATSGDSVVPIENGTASSQPGATSRNIERAGRELQRQLQVAGKAGEVQVEFNKEGGLKITMPNQFLFDTAKAELRPEADPVFQSLAGLLAELSGIFIEVRGHTDSRPLRANAKYRDNYDLSYARADAVARRLNTLGRILMDQFEIVACGPGQPVATNDSEEGMQANRRVEIFVRSGPDRSKMSELKARMSPGGQDGSARGAPSQ